MLVTQELQANVTPLPGAGSEYAVVNKASMFIDLVDSTTWHVSQDDISAFESLRSCLNRMSDFVHAYSGDVVKFLGDGLHATFERPVDALRCAVAFQSAMGFARVESDNAVPNARVSLSFGACVRYEMCGREDYYGYLVILASRLAQHGKGGDIIMSEEFRSHYDVDCALTPTHVKTEVRSIKGFPNPIRVYCLEAAQLPLINTNENISIRGQI